ncbi:outer membrane usher protein [Serratia fonticola]|jgi:outer membrane usher protein PapC|uniref:outer membrane usher protein n=1 Tax=Serratia TaxID=613 RepID=UPI000A694E3D|nr:MULTISPECIES: outer membrane usher protein [Serratia]MCO7511492.1 outer membrane usher protein [Serratia fonticola]
MSKKILKLSKSGIACIVVLAFLGQINVYAAEETQFNTDILDTNDKKNLDLSVFAVAGYIMPGVYRMAVILNQKKITDFDTLYYSTPEDEKSSFPCLTKELVAQLGLKEGYLSNLKWQPGSNKDEVCLVIPADDGWKITSELPTSTLNLSIPQAFLEYTAPNWDPPSRWDNGVFGALFDYNTNFTTIRPRHSGQNNSMSGNGTAGVNFGPWRARADWQAQLDNKSAGSSHSNRFDWTRYYIYRPIKSLKARLSLGENFVNSDIFDSFRFTGVSLRSDDSMLPPNLRGYAPEITGVAKTNAKVTVRQQGAVLYQTQVAPGPFKIQDLNDAVNGQLDVEVEEQDGSNQKFSVQTSDIPYLTRPGTLRYMVSAGRPTDFRHRSQGPLFSMGEFSWGVANGWSLYGGNTVNNDYQALAVGIGRDLMLFGALSLDATHSRAKLPQTETLQGNSYRLSYSKRFDEFNSQVTFAGYRFSERDYLSMADYLDARQSDYRRAGTKEMYTVSFNQQFTGIGASLFVDYNHRTYWNSSVDDRYNIALAKYLDIANVKNINISVNAYRSKFNNSNDDGVYLSLSVPWGDHGSIGLNSSRYKGGSSNQVSYFSTLNDFDSYQISVGKNGAQNAASGFYSHAGDNVQVNANASYQELGFTSAGIGLQGGLTATMKGGALHRINTPGSARVMVDTDGVSDVPVRGFGAVARSNIFGKAVVSDVNNYYRNQLSIDVNKLSDNAEAINTVEQITLTEGAIGYRHFSIVQGEKALIYIRLPDGSSPPFGATVLNKDNREVGIVNDDGSVYLSGIQASAIMQLRWNGAEQCQISFPTNLVNEKLQNILLPCIFLNEKKSN